MRSDQIRLALKIAVSAILLALCFVVDLQFGAETSHTSSQFQGVKANTGTVTHTKAGNKNILTLSDDFVPPDTPDPHWQVVDSKGKVYLLDRLKAKGDKYNRSITVPSYVPDIAKVQIWCAFAEANLGEASFASPVK